MGVYTKQYVIIGYDLWPLFEKMDSDQLDDFIEDMELFADNRELDFIYDGMSGEYCFIGKVLNESNQEDEMPIKKHSLSELEGIQTDTYTLLSELKIHQYPALYSFTHWY